MTPSTRAMVHGIAVNASGALRDSALDELAREDKARELGRLELRDWTGPLGAPRLPPTMALSAPRIPRKLPRLCDAAREALSAVRAKAAPYARGLTANVLAWPLCGLALAIAWGIGFSRPAPIEPPLVLPPLPELSYLEQRVLSERRVREADKAMQHLHRVDRGCIYGAGFGVVGGLALAIVITAIGA